MAKRPSPETVVIDLLSDHEEEGNNVTKFVNPPAADDANRTKVCRKKIKIEGATSTATPRAATTTSGDDVEVVSPAAPELVPTNASAADEDVVLVGAINEQKLPHLREHCPEHKFDKNGYYWCSTTRRNLYRREALATNVACCDLCYCYAW